MLLVVVAVVVVAVEMLITHNNSAAISVSGSENKKFRFPKNIFVFLEESTILICFVSSAFFSFSVEM